MQAVLPENIERIEVISGPGATLWGANAVNGVINIITRRSADTQGGVADIGAGNLQRSASLQYGGRISDDLSYRVHMEGSTYSPFKTPQGTDAEDSWATEQGGFRLDWTPAGDRVSVQADSFSNQEVGGNAAGRDVVANWQHQLDNGSSLQLNAYYDDARRSGDNGLGFVVDTFNVDLQHNFSVLGWNNIVWGVGERVIDYQLANTQSLAFIPSGRTLNLANIFAQDTLELTDRLKLTLGMKLEDEPYSGVEAMPSARLSWKLADSVLLWSAVSRAVRAPTPIDEDLVETVGTTPILTGSRAFLPEVLTAYEFGTRVQPLRELSFSVSAFYNDYSDLRTIEVTPVTVLPLHWGNLMDGHIYGVEVWGTYQPISWWRLSTGFNVQHEHLVFEAGSSGLAGIAFAADDPNFQTSFRSSIRLSDDIAWNADLRHIGEIHDIAVPSYTELNTGVSWMMTKSLELSVSGFNLLHSRHTEFIEAGESDEVPRSFFVETRWRF
jgi:iron complex outermembrane receptor protein